MTVQKTPGIHVLPIFAGAFKDGRVLVGITHFDESYQIRPGEDSITEADICTKMCMIVANATKQPILEPEGVILPVSGLWALYSNRLYGISEHRFPVEFKQRKGCVIGCLNNCPQVAESFSDGENEITSWNIVEATKLAVVLRKASRIDKFIERYVLSLLDPLC